MRHDFLYNNYGMRRRTKNCWNSRLLSSFNPYRLQTDVAIRFPIYTSKQFDFSSWINIILNFQNFEDTLWANLNWKRVRLCLHITGLARLFNLQKRCGKIILDPIVSRPKIKHQINKSEENGQKTEENKKIKPCDIIR